MLFFFIKDFSNALKYSWRCGKTFSFTQFDLPRIRTLIRGGEMRGSVTPTASKLEGGAKRVHKTVFFVIGRVYVFVGKHSHSLSSIYRESN